MKALVDGDILLYELGCAKDDETGEPTAWPLVKSRVDGKIKKIVEAAGADTYVVYISGDTNFRDDVATIKPYKGNRTGEKPHHHSKIKEYLSSGLNHPVEVVEGMEADDAMGIAQVLVHSRAVACKLGGSDKDCWQGTIICSRDKDLKMIPGWHYSWKSGKQEEKEPFFVSEADGMRWFFTQLLTGDPTDNIPGLFGVGAVAAKKLLDGLTSPLSMYQVVRYQYERRFGLYWNLFMMENAQLLWILREDGWSEPREQVVLLLDELADDFEEEQLSNEY